MASTELPCRVTRASIECFESAEGERFAFDIDVVFPIIGHVVHYEGVLIERPQLDEWKYTQKGRRSA